MSKTMKVGLFDLFEAIKVQLPDEALKLVVPEEFWKNLCLYSLLV
jgi:hypothetical protein